MTTKQTITKYYKAISDDEPLAERVRQLDEACTRLSRILKQGEIGLWSWHGMAQDSMCEVVAHLAAAGIVAPADLTAECAHANSGM